MHKSTGAFRLDTGRRGTLGHKRAFHRWHSKSCEPKRRFIPISQASGRTLLFTALFTPANSPIRHKARTVAWATWLSSQTSYSPALCWWVRMSKNVPQGSAHLTRLSPRIGSKQNNNNGRLLLALRSIKMMVFSSGRESYVYVIYILLN